LLKKLAEQLAWPLAKVMRSSLQEGAVLEDWRTANVMPIFKKGKRSDPGNYRPVSLTSVVCRLMESLVKDQIVSHLERNGLIRATQHSFMRGKLCTTNLLAFLEKITTAVDEVGTADVVYKDFGTVPHKRLKKKLKVHGISSKLFSWITAWLHGRKQWFALNSKESTWEEVLSEVTQGSVLGPLLFLLFINDLDLSVSELEQLLKFADNTKVAHVIESDEDR
jgi:Reverse transcriptase (RNA-dependent DNA polymerase)